LKKTILFDLDGTVIDSTDAILESFAVVAKQYGECYDPAHVTSLIGHPLSVMFRELGIEEEHNEAHVLAYKAYYRTVANQKTYLLPNAKEAIELAASFARLGVVTTKTGRYSKEILDHLGVGAFFETIVGFEHVTHPKPHEEPILLALDQMQVPKEGAYIIGDTHLDILSAKNAKITPIAVRSGYESHSDLSKHTSLIFKDVLEAVKYLYEC